jgi:hypothetical protein
MKANFRKFAASLLVTASAAAPLHGVTFLYTTGFDGPGYTDGGLIGQDGWVITGTSVVNPIKVANTATDGTVTLTTTGQDVRRLFTPAVVSDSLFMKFEITVASAQATGDYSIHLGDGGASNFYARTYIKSSDAGFSMALGTSSGTTGLVYGGTLDFNTTYNILVRYDLVAGLANDTGALFVNPTTLSGTGDTAYVAATNVGVDATTLSSFSFRQGTASSAAGLTIDDVAVFVVPEPATALLGAVGLLGLLRRRR